MNILEIFLVVWVVVAIVSYVLVGIYSKDWSFHEKDMVLLFPIVNVIVLGLVLIIMLDEWIVNRKSFEPND